MVSAEAKEKPLLAGAGRRGTNPPPNIAHGGWGAQKHEQAEGIDMDLWATALALSDATNTAILIDIDIQILTNQIADRIRLAVSSATGLPVENIRASATHTHSGPVPYKSWIKKGYEMVGPWFDNLCQWCVEASAEALANLEPVQARAGRGQCHINANRRSTTENGERFLGINPDGPSDHEVLIVRLDNALKAPVATLVNFACHGTVMGPLNRLITPDYPGPMKRVVEQAVGGKCLFLQGAAGDQGPVQGFQADPKVYRDLGAILGHEAAAIALSLTALPSKVRFREIIPSGAPLGAYDNEFAILRAQPLKMASCEIALPLRASLPEKKAAAEKLDFWTGELKTGREQQDQARITKATFMARRADLELRMAEDFGGKSTAGVRAHFITFGDVALVGCNVEPFCETGMNIKRLSSFPITCFSGYTNGRMAYLPTAGEWMRGGYEVENSPFGERAAEVLETEVLRILQSLRTN